MLSIIQRLIQRFNTPAFKESEHVRAYRLAFLRSMVIMVLPIGLFFSIALPLLPDSRSRAATVNETHIFGAGYRQRCLCVWYLPDRKKWT